MEALLVATCVPFAALSMSRVRSCGFGVVSSLVGELSPLARPGFGETGKRSGLRRFKRESRLRIVVKTGRAVEGEAYPSEAAQPASVEEIHAWIYLSLPVGRHFFATASRSCRVRVHAVTGLMDPTLEGVTAIAGKEAG